MKTIDLMNKLQSVLKSKRNQTIVSVDKQVGRTSCHDDSLIQIHVQVHVDEVSLALVHP